MRNQQSAAPDEADSQASAALVTHPVSCPSAGEQTALNDMGSQGLRQTPDQELATGDREGLAAEPR